MDNRLRLLVDCCSMGEMYLDLNEATSTALGRNLTRFKGKMQEAEAINKNGRRYSKKILSENVDRLKGTMSDRRLCGELDHPTDSIVHFSAASHLITKLWWEGNNLMGEGEILNTPNGKILKSLLADGVKIGISSRGVGSGKEENGVLEISDNYRLITFDVVSDPSTNGAFQEEISDSTKHEAININKNSYNVTKNESSSLYRVNKDLLIAHMGGFIKEHQTNHKRG